MSEIITASAVRFNALPTAHDGYTLLYENNRVCQSDVKLSELVGDMSAYLTEEKANTLYQGKGDYLSASTSANFYPMTGNPSGFLTTHQPISADDWNSCYETVSTNSGIWGSEYDWTAEINAASANAVDVTKDWVEEQDYLTAHQSLDEYATINYVDNGLDLKQDKGDYYSASNPSGFITGVDLSNYYTKQETSGAAELSTEFSKYMEIPTELSDDKQYGYTVSGWEEISAGSNLSAGTDLKIENNVVSVDTNGSAVGKHSFVEGENTYAGGLCDHVEGIGGIADNGGLNHIEGFQYHSYGGNGSSSFIGKNVVQFYHSTTISTPGNNISGDIYELVKAFKERFIVTCEYSTSTEYHYSQSNFFKPLLYKIIDVSLDEDPNYFNVTLDGTIPEDANGGIYLLGPTTFCNITGTGGSLSSDQILQVFTFSSFGFPGNDLELIRTDNTFIQLNYYYTLPDESNVSYTKLLKFSNIEYDTTNHVYILTTEESIEIPEIKGGGWGCSIYVINESYYGGNHKEGRDNSILYGSYNHAEGAGNVIRNANNAHVEGEGTSALSTQAHAEGYCTYVTGSRAHAEGYKTSAIGTESHAEGSATSAKGQCSHAEGNNTKANEYASHAEGVNTFASGYASHTEGYNTKAFKEWTHAEGSNTSAVAYGSHAEGQYTLANGVGTHTEGNLTSAYGSEAHAEGYCTYAWGSQSHAENYYTSAYGNYSHAEGQGTLANNYAHAEGQFTHAEGDDSHAEGQWTSALGSRSHSEGHTTIANGTEAHAEGFYTSANSNYSHTEGYYTIANAPATHTEGDHTSANGWGAHTEGSATSAAGNAAHAEGINTFVTGDGSHAEGYNTSAFGDAIHAEGSGTSACGHYAHAEGLETTAGYNSHAEGDKTSANAPGAHAEGYRTTAYYHAHAEGDKTFASGSQSHAEGSATSAIGDDSHAEGIFTIAGTDYMHAGGKYNKTSANVAFVIGNGSGTNVTARSDAFVVDWNGKASATILATSGIADLEAKIKELENAGGGDMEKSKLEYSNNQITGYDGSAFAAGGDAGLQAVNKQVTMPIGSTVANVTLDNDKYNIIETITSAATELDINIPKSLTKVQEGAFEFSVEPNSVLVTINAYMAGRQLPIKAPSAFDSTKLYQGTSLNNILVIAEFDTYPITINNISTNDTSSSIVITVDGTMGSEPLPNNLEYTLALSIDGTVTNIDATGTTVTLTGIQYTNYSNANLVTADVIIDNKNYGTFTLKEADPYNPLNLPANTIRVRYSNGKVPSSTNPNITITRNYPYNEYDITYNNNNWQGLFSNNNMIATATKGYITDVLGANTTNVTAFGGDDAQGNKGCFESCTALSSVQIFDTSNAVDFGRMFTICSKLNNVPLFDMSNASSTRYMFYNCTSMSSAPEFDISNVENLHGMFEQTKLTAIPEYDLSNAKNISYICRMCYSLKDVPLFKNTNSLVSSYDAFGSCSAVSGGISALYTQLAACQSLVNGNHNGTFKNCGTGTNQGAAELANIPSDWK